MIPIKLQSIVDEIECQMDDYNKYLDTQTGQVICVSSEDLRIAEESETDDDFSEYPEWQQPSIKQAMDVLVNCFSDKYIMLPTIYDINEYDIIKEFCGTVQNCQISDSLYSAIRGSGAFRRFRDAICRYGIEDSWYKFRNGALKQLAIIWCERNNISYLADASDDK
ncbi:MAG: UPF0158 family protein [Saccharofermentanales bacterium]